MSTTDTQQKKAPAPAKVAYEDLDTLHDANGLIARISRRTRTGEITFAVFKVFERDGETQQTSYVPASMGDAYVAMTQTALKRCAELASDPPVNDRESAKYNRGRR